MPETKGWYNGYSWKERDRKYQTMKCLIAKGDLPAPEGNCDLCGDPDAKLEYHDEDYSLPYLWTRPALFTLCHYCHVARLHKRFANPAGWSAYLAHVRRGGYGSDRFDRDVVSELRAARLAIQSGARPELRPLRPYRASPGKEWFASLPLDPFSLTNPAARPRP